MIKVILVNHVPMLQIIFIKGWDAGRCKILSIPILGFLGPENIEYDSV